MIISTDGFEPYRPIKMIISDMFCGCCGLDYSCIKYVLDIMTNAKFYKQKYSNLNKMREMILSLGEKIKEDKDENDTINALFLFTLPEETGLENIEEVFVALDNVIDGDVIWQGCLNSDENDESCTITIIYGKGNKL